jgi:alpha-tubulin suppressor-like RCC1 family protein
MLRAVMTPTTSKRMTRVCVALVLGGATACTSILGSFDVTTETTGNDAGDAQTSDVVDSGGQDVAPDAPSSFLAGATQVVGGARHTCALVGTDVYCWGDNTVGQLAQNAGVTRSAKPLKVGLTAPATAIAAGANHTCAIAMTKDLICWGANDVGECGAGDTMNPSPPRPVTSMTSGLQWELVAGGESNTCAVEGGGATYCWGANDKGQSGSAGAGPITKATNAGAEKSMYASLALGFNHGCGATSTTAHCWGTEFKGELGDGLANNSNAVGNDVMNLTGVHAIVAGANHTCVRDANDQIRCWGDNEFGQLGIVADGGTQQLLPGAVIPGGPYQALSGRYEYTCFIASQGGVVSCVGTNDSGQLGRGGTTDMSPHLDVQPVLSPDMASAPLVATAIGTGREHACAIIAGGGVVCWGNGSDGQLGDGTVGGGARPTPVHVTKP